MLDTRRQYLTVYAGSTTNNRPPGMEHLSSDAHGPCRASGTFVAPGPFSGIELMHAIAKEQMEDRGIGTLISSKSTHSRYKRSSLCCRLFVILPFRDGITPSHPEIVNAGQARRFPAVDRSLAIRIAS